MIPCLRRLLAIESHSKMIEATVESDSMWERHLEYIWVSLSWRY
jgi:hypothetical protein